jgi:hypothetical protein
MAASSARDRTLIRQDKRFLTCAEMEQLENAPDVLLRRLVTRIDRDRTP